MLHGAWLLSIALAAQTPPSPVPPPEPTPIADDRPIVDIFQNFIADIRALPSPESALVAGVGGGASLALGAADDDVDAWSESEGQSPYTKALGWIGDGWVQAGGAFGTYAVGVLTKHRLTRHVGSDLIRAQFMNGVLTRSLKIVVDRTRPSGGGHSFPSGHSSATFTSAAVLHSHFGWKVGAPAYAVAGLVGWTRVRDRAHWLSDVAVGATLGTIVGRTVARGHGERAWTIVPTASATSVAIHITRTAGDR